MKAKPMAKEEADRRMDSVQEELIEVLNRLLVSPSVEGKLYSGDAIYIGSGALAKCAAILMLSQLLPRNFHKAKSLTTSFKTVFDDVCDQIMRVRLKETSTDSKPVEQTTSAWSAVKEVIKKCSGS